MAAKLKSFVHRAGRRREVPARRAPPIVQLGDVEDVGLEAEPLAVGTVEELLAERRQPGRVVELVAVDAEDPRVRPRVALDESVRVTGPPNAHRLDVVEIGGHASDGVPRAVGGHVVGDVEAIAERGHVTQRLLHELVLVVDEHDAHDAQAQRRSVVQSSSGRTGPRRCPGNLPFDESPSPRSKTLKETASRTAVWWISLFVPARPRLHTATSTR